jgi:purine-binding chemotaxis protein CheW
VSETCVRVRVGAEEYALPVRHVPEVAELGDVTPVPGTPAQVLGIRNLRGEVLPVFDLAVGLGAQGSGAPERIILADVDGRRCALAVDEVLEVAELEEAQEAVDSPLLAGAVLLEGRLVGLIDVPALLTALAPHEAP